MRKGTLKLYGEIWDWNENSAQNFMHRLNVLDNGGYDAISLHVHCKGGDVLEGIAIYNALKACKTPVDLYVDGVAASMMTIIMLACRRIYMASNSFLMIHAPSGFTHGTAKAMMQTANTLSEMEKNFTRAYSAKTGKTESEVSEWLDGDNWFSASQALGNKIIDGIVDAVDTKAVSPQDSEIKNYTANMLYQRYAALATAEDKKPKSQKSESKMNKEEIIKKYGLKTVTADSSEEAIYDAIANEPKAAAEAALKLERTAQVNSIVAAAKTAKKLTDEQVTTFTAIGESMGVEAMQKALSAVNPAPTITSILGGQTGGGADDARANWTWDDYQKNDAGALEALEKSDKATFQSLFDAKYKKK
jgi:Protease subunit of ATP-dependent Clp proteases